MTTEHQDAQPVLPPLPEAAHRGPTGTGSYFDSFTGDQMQAYARAALAVQQAPTYAHPMTFAYLACPLAHPDPIVESDRIELASLAAAYLMDSGLAVFSPLSHCYLIKKHLAGSRPHQWWMEQDLRILHSCDELFVLPLEGWRDSKGVSMEIDFFQSQGRPITVIQHLPGAYGRRLETVGVYEAAAQGWKIHDTPRQY